MLLFPRSDLASGYSKEGLIKHQESLTTPTEAPPYRHSGAVSSFSMPDHPNNLGPLPSNWEIAYTANNEKYFIDHNTGTTHWLDPRLAGRMKQNILECSENGELSSLLPPSLIPQKKVLTKSPYSIIIISHVYISCVVEPQQKEEFAGGLRLIDRHALHCTNIVPFSHSELPYGWEKVNDPQFGTYYIK